MLSQESFSSESVGSCNPANGENRPCVMVQDKEHEGPVHLEVLLLKDANLSVMGITIIPLLASLRYLQATPDNK